MNKADVLDALKKVRESNKRNFNQKIDLIINLRDLDLKKPEHQVDFFLTLPQDIGKNKKICALVGPELAEEAKQNCDFTILADDFEKYAKDKKLTKKLAKDYDFFIAQANLMGQIASSFGRVLGPRGKMPNPKAGCVVPPKTALKPICDRLRITVRISARIQPIIQCIVGNEKMADEEIIENATTVYNQLIHHLPNEQNNIKSIFIKLTMGKPVRIR